MKKLIVTLFLALMLFNVCFSFTALEKLLLPEFKGDLSSVDYKIVDSTDQDLVIEIDGVYYIVKK